jgi:hypothetical protein
MRRMSIRGSGENGTQAGALERALALLYPHIPARVRYTWNRTILVSLVRHGEIRELRAQRAFRDAPHDVAAAVVRLHVGRPPPDERRRLSHLVSAWHHHMAPLPPSPPSGALLHGTHHHLPALLEGVNATFFDGRLDVDVTYGRVPARRTMGRHERRDPRGLIVVNPLIDHPVVKPWYIRYILFHEGLHDLMPPRPAGGRMVIHPPEFRRAERAFPDLARTGPYEKWLTGAGYGRLLDDYRARSSQIEIAPPIRATPAATASQRRIRVRGRRSTGRS